MIKINQKAVQRIITIALTVMGCVAQAQAAVIPLATMVINPLPASATPRDGFTRLRLNLTSNEMRGSQTIRLAGMSLCTTSICYEAGVPSSLIIFSTINGTATVAAEIEVPYSNIDSVRFKFAAGRDVLHGNIFLPEPLILNKEFNGGDVLVVIQKQGSDYVPIAAASNYIQPEGTTVFYNPKFATNVKLPLGVTLTIAESATSFPHVFLVGAHDTGDDYPLVDIHPKLQLAKPAIVQLPTISRAAMVGLAEQQPATPKPLGVSPRGATMPQVKVVQTPAPIIIETEWTGTVPRTPQAAPPRKQSSLLGSDKALVANVAVSPAAAASCNAAGWCNCADQLAYPPSQQTIGNSLSATGTTYLDWCTTIPPYMHITVTNMADARERFTIKHLPKVIAGASTRYVTALPLARITSWSANTQVMTNGFYWQGDSGTSTGQHGLADGHVHNFATGLGDNFSQGGSCQDFPSPPYNPCTTFNSGGNKRVMRMPASGAAWSWEDNARPGIISNSQSYVSSSTSIVKDGVCSNDATISRWTAVGNTSGGRVILMSSTTDGQTTAAELCAIFKAMGVNNAIRLDGGPSAAMTVDGLLKNPLGGLYFVKYGTARYIPYAVKIANPGR